MKMDLILHIKFAITPVDESNKQQFFSSASNILSCNEEKTELIKGKKNK